MSCRLEKPHLHLGSRHESIRNRQRKRDFAAVARRALYRNVAPVRFAYMTHQRQTEATALRVVHERIAGAIKLVEYLRLIATRNADTAVGDLQLHRSVIAK